MGPTTTYNVERAAGNLLRLGRSRRRVTQRQLAELAGVPQSTIARIESGDRQPSVPTLYRLLAALDLEPRIRLEDYDDHDDVLDRLAQRYPEQQVVMEQARDATLTALGAAR